MLLHQRLEASAENQPLLRLQSRFSFEVCLYGSTDVAFLPVDSCHKFEAMACKTAIIATSIDGNKETIFHMETAYTVSPNNPVEINTAVNYLFENPQKQKIIIDNAYNLVLKYDWEQVGQKYLDIYFHAFVKSICTFSAEKEGIPLKTFVENKYLPNLHIDICNGFISQSSHKWVQTHP